MFSPVQEHRSKDYGRQQDALSDEFNRLLLSDNELSHFFFKGDLAFSGSLTQEFVLLVDQSSRLLFQLFNLSFA